MQVPKPHHILSLAVRRQQRVAILAPVEAQKFAIVELAKHILGRRDALVIDANGVFGDRGKPVLVEGVELDPKDAIVAGLFNLMLARPRGTCITKQQVVLSSCQQIRTRVRHPTKCINFVTNLCKVDLFFCDSLRVTSCVHAAYRH